MTPRSSYLVAVAAALLLGPATSAAPSQMALAEDLASERWIDGVHEVRSIETHEDAILHVNGSILIGEGGVLTLRNTRLVFEGNGSQALGVQGGGELRLESTPRGATSVKARSIESEYFFTNFGTLIARGLPEAPVLIENVTGFSGNVGPALSGGLFFNGLQLVGPRTELDHVVFAMSGSGIGISSTGETIIRNTVTIGVNVGLYIYNAKNVLIEGSYITGADSAIYARKASNVTIRDSVIEGKSFGFVGRQSGVTFVNDTFQGGVASAELTQGGDYAFEASRFQGYTVLGLESVVLPGAASQPTRVELRGNVFDGRDEAAMAVSNERDVTLDILMEGNYVANHTGNGVTIGVGNAVFRGNTFERNGQYGAHVVAAIFLEEGNSFGLENGNVNADGGFKGSTPVTIRVVDGDDGTVPNATLAITGGPGSQERSMQVGPTGEITPILPALDIGNDGARVVHSYTAAANATGHPPGRRSFEAYGATEPVLVRLGEVSEPASISLASFSLPVQTVAYAVLGLAASTAIAAAGVVLWRRRAS